MPYKDEQKRIEWSKNYNLKNKDIKKEYNKNYYIKNKENLLNKSKKYRLEHIEDKTKYEKERYKRESSKQKEYSKKYRMEHREWEKNSQLKSRYGITLDEYNELSVKQNGVCAICLNNEKSKNKFGNTRNLYVDHDHKTGKVRGLLCHNCNSMLGYSGDNPMILKIGKDYLIRNKTS
jgi:hypothetical protein